MNAILSEIQQKALDMLEQKIILNSLLYSTISGYVEVLYNQNSNEFKFIQAHLFDHEPDWELIIKAYFKRFVRIPMSYTWEFEINDKIIFTKISIPYAKNMQPHRFEQNISIHWKPFPYY